MNYDEKIKMAQMGLRALGYDEVTIANLTLDFNEDGYLLLENLLPRIDPKDVLILIDFLVGVGAVPLYDKQEAPGFDLYDDHVDLSEMNRWLKQYMLKVDKEAPTQSTYVIEEVSELVTELMCLVKCLTKAERGLQDNKQLVFEEACDVMAAIIMMFVRDGYHLNDVLPYITSKYKRAVERFDENSNV